MSALFNRRPARIGATLTASALLAASAWWGPSALADDRPIIGTFECDQLLAVDAAVVAAADELGAAIDALDLLAAGGTTEEIADAEARIDVAGSTLDEVTADAEARLCTTETSTGPTNPVTPPVTPSSPTSPSVTVDAVLAQIAALDCGPTFAADRGAISDARSALVGSVSSREFGRTTDALDARERTLGFCLDPGLSVDPTDDDGSEVDGSQVGIIPDGSIATGAP